GSASPPTSHLPSLKPLAEGEEDDVEDGGFLPACANGLGTNSSNSGGGSSSSTGNSNGKSKGDASKSHTGRRTELLGASSAALEAALGYDDASYGKSPAQQVCLEWRHVRLTVVSPRGLLMVLRDVGGRAPAGAVTALLGPSGAGKSTLLDLLALRGAAALPEGPSSSPSPASSSPSSPASSSPSAPDCSGQVLVNGQPRDRRAFLRSSSYVPQEDAF
ncbi:hypothetical protein Agub_g12702, partial [Astrephomene gubernaculifera]